jgi:transposase-like protein
VDNATKENIVPIIRENIDRESHVMTDEASRYSKIGSEFAKAPRRGSLAQGVRLHRPRDWREGQHKHD